MNATLFHPNPFFIANVGLAAFSIIIGLTVYIKSKNNALGLSWSLFASSVAVWGIGAAIISIESNPNAALKYWRLSYFFGVNWISILFYHFVCIFIQERKNPYLYFHYGIAILFTIFTPTKLFFNGTRLIFNSFYWATPGVAGILFTFWWNGLVVWSHKKLFDGYKFSDTVKKNQIKYFFLATAIGFGGGCTEFFPLLGIDLYPWGSFLTAVYPFIMGFAILKYQLMDVRIFIRRTGLFIGIYGLLLIGMTPIIASFHRGITTGQISTPFIAWLQVLIITGALSLGPFLYAYFLRRSSYFNEHAAAGLTHELKSPLAAIQSALEYIKEEAANNRLNPKQAEYFALIERNSSRLNTFVNELLQIFKLQNKKGHLSDEPLDFILLCKTLIKTYEPLAQFKGNSIEFQSDQGFISASCDKQKIEYVISNLLSNAIKFTLQGTIKLSLTKKDDEILISVQDNGSGIPPRDLPYIFDPFYQGSSSGGIKGSGIGLTIAKTWVEAHGGHIWAGSEGDGKGTNVTFTIPAK